MSGTIMDKLAELGDDAFLRAVTPSFEDLRRMTSRPYSPGQHRWFRTVNVADLIAYRRELGVKEWTEHDPGEGVTAESLRMPAISSTDFRRIWPANVVVLATYRRRKGRWLRPAPPDGHSAA